jgi:HYR domain
MTKRSLMLALICSLLFLLTATPLAAVIVSHSIPATSRKPQMSGQDSPQNEWRSLKQEMDRAIPSDAQVDRYHELLTQINSSAPPARPRRKRSRVRTEATSPCISGDLQSGGPTFQRPQLMSSPPGFVQPCTPSATGSAVIYQFYEFTLSGCTTPTITANTCGTGSCSTTGTLTDSVLLVYQKSDGSPSTPGSPIFDPSASCTNLVAANDDFCGSLSQVTSALMPGNFVVVVTTFFSGDTGTYSLSVDAPGCTISQVTPCSLTCPANITKANDSNQCGAIVNYPSPTTSGTCATVTCAPASGSFFPKGTTTVACNDSGGATCSFTVTVNDTQPPSITCPANITATESPAGSGSATVNYTTPTPTDNCPGATASCAPPSGSSFPVGTTTVTCTAMDTSGNTATCHFSVTVNAAATFSNCVQDDANPGNVVLFDKTTGHYTFCCNGTVVASGTGTVSVRGLVITLQDYSSTKRVLITVDQGTNRGTASIQSPPGTLVCSISDRNLSNDTCTCGGGGGTTTTAPPDSGTPPPPGKSKKKH